MKNSINSAYKELQNLYNGFAYTIAQINWWLLKYGDLYKSITKNQNMLCENCLRLKAENLPYDCMLKPSYCNKNDEYQSFIKFYNDLDKATELHKLENNCFRAYNEYTFLICTNESLRDWVIKYYEIFEKIEAYFFGYLEFNSEDDKKLYVAEAPYKSFGVAITGQDFIHSLNFYDAYNELYYNQKLYPEKIKEWEDFFSKIELPKDEL